jgi:hypothetical protein
MGSTQRKSPIPVFARAVMLATTFAERPSFTRDMNLHHGRFYVETEGWFRSCFRGLAPN